jgi:hypothetical protein
MKPTLHIVVNPKTGEVQFEVEGMMGTGCTDLTAALTQGHAVQEERLTEDYYAPQEEPAYTGE